MKTSAPVDDMPQFKGFSLNASNLMIEANALRARGELYAAAVAFVQAGRDLETLMRRFLSEGFVWHATQSALESAECFLEVGDERPADAIIRMAENSPGIVELLDSDAHFAADQRRLAVLREHVNRERLAGWGQMRSQMESAHGAMKLSEGWIKDVLERLPGVPEFHFYVSRKRYHQQRWRDATYHLGVCVELQPDLPDMWGLLVHCFEAANDLDRAIEAADRALSHHPANPKLLFAAGWTRVQKVFRHSGSKNLLLPATHFLSRSLESGMLSSEDAVTTSCILALALRRLSREAEAAEVLRSAIERYPLPAAYLAEQLRGTKREQQRVEHELPKRARELQGAERLLGSAA